jgi:hypothetical protein
VTLRPEIEFSSTFPDDTIEDEVDIVQWPGRNIAEALKGALEPRGYQVSDPVHAHEHGWELDISKGRKRLWVQISVLSNEVNYLVAKSMSLLPWDGGLFRSFLEELQAVLEADDRFVRVRWFPKGGIAGNAAPAAGPFGD